LLHKEVIVSTTTIVRQQPTAEHPLLVIERILRDREGIWQQIKSEYRLNALIGQMLVSATGALACYGLVLGFSNGLPQALASAIKLPVLFFLTLAICLPTLYLFNLLFGARLSVRQALALVLVAITVTAVLTLAFAPISLFFLITAPSYAFFKLLNVAIMTLTGAVGIGFLIGGMRSLNTLAAAELAAEPANLPVPAEAQIGETPQPTIERPVSVGLLNIWIVLYGFVGTQLAWTLRPFFGDPNKPFQIFRPIESNFYVNIVQTLMNLFN
jgi:hypothetical protein